MAEYNEDLAWIHAEGFGWYALATAPGLLSLLRNNGIDSGLVVDLGCGNGIWPRQLTFAGYEALGVDASPDMIRLAKRTAPAARFVVDDIPAAKLPRCSAVTSIGEVLSYVFHADADFRSMRKLFRTVHRALRRGGVFIFDIGTPGLLPGGMPRKGFWTGADWAVMVEAHEEDGTGILVRELISFRLRGKCYRRTEETHRLRLYSPGDIEAELSRAGFLARRLRGFGRVRFTSGHAGFLARKPG